MGSIKRSIIPGVEKATQKWGGGGGGQKEDYTDKVAQTACSKACSLNNFNSYP